MLQPPPPASYKLAWSDELSGPDGASPDSSKWTYDVGGNGWGNNELEYYTNRTKNAQIQGGNLMITAQKETYAGSDGVTRNYTSARLKNPGAFQPSLWPLRSANQDSRGAGNVACLLDARQRYHLQWLAEVRRNRHHGKYREGAGHRSRIPAWPEHRRPRATPTAPFSLPAGQNFADDFHLYAVEWEPGTIRFYVDTALYVTFKSSQWPTGGSMCSL